MGEQRTYKLIRIYLVPGDDKKDVLRAAWSNSIDFDLFFHDQFVVEDKPKSWWVTFRRQIFGR